MKRKRAVKDDQTTTGKTVKDNDKTMKSTKVKEVYSSAKYWDDRYISGGNHSWYYEYEDLKPLLDDIVGITDTIVEIGCGDAPLLTGMAKSRNEEEYQIVDNSMKYGRLIGVDFSKTIIDTLNKEKMNLDLIHSVNNSLTYVHMDARDLSEIFPLSTNDTVDSSDIDEGIVDVVIDKGTMDAMLCGNNDNYDSDKEQEEQEEEEGFANVREMLSEVLRITKKTSSYMLISHMQFDSDAFQEALHESIMPVLEDPKWRNRRWELEVHTHESEDNDDEDNDDERPAVYIFRSRPRRFTRLSDIKGKGTSLTVTVKEH